MKLRKINSKIGIFGFRSELLGKEVLLHAIFPKKHESFTKQLPVLYLLHGLFGRFDNWLTNTKIVEYAQKNSFVIICADGSDSWYSDSSLIPNHFYESYFLDELIPAVEENFNIGKTRQKRAIAGLSMGGYGAFKFAFRRPQMFSFAASMSGAFHASEIYDDEVLQESIFRVFGNNHSIRNENDLFKTAANFPAGQIAELPYFYFDCGTNDGFLPFNRSFHELLQQRAIAHDFKIFPGEHDWDYWNSQLKKILKITTRLL